MAALQSVEPYLLHRVVSDQEAAVIAQIYLAKWEDLSPFLNLTDVDEQAIRNTYSDYKEQKRALLLEWKRQNGSGATYRVLIAAAKEAHNKNLADNLEEMLRQTDHTESAANTTATGDYDDEVKSKTSSQHKPATVINRSEVASLQKEIERHHQKFKSIKKATMKCLEKCKIVVSMVVYLLSQILGSEHQIFVETNHQVLEESKSHMELFKKLNFYWSYLSFDLLDKLLDELVEENSDFGSIKVDMEKYKEGIQIFRESTKLALYCEAVPHSDCDPPPGFYKMVTKHQWPETVTLEDVERFRRSFLHTVKLEKCAVMVLHNIETGSFKVTWFAELAPSFIQSLSEETIKVFEDSRVISIEIDEKCVYQSPLFVDNCSIFSDSTQLFEMYQDQEEEDDEEGEDEEEEEDEEDDEEGEEDEEDDEEGEEEGNLETDEESSNDDALDGAAPTPKRFKFARDKALEASSA